MLHHSAVFENVVFSVPIVLQVTQVVQLGELNVCYLLLQRSEQTSLLCLEPSDFTSVWRLRERRRWRHTMSSIQPCMRWGPTQQTASAPEIQSYNSTAFKDGPSTRKCFCCEVWWKWRFSVSTLQNLFHYLAESSGGQVKLPDAKGVSNI